jgi:hypothetical protein
MIWSRGVSGVTLWVIVRVGKVGLVKGSICRSNKGEWIQGLMGFIILRKRILRGDPRKWNLLERGRGKRAPGITRRL